ncbi:MAG TPA: SGNH/GDSL hydrolase family protein, partial [Geminicoccaceae bacterium]
EGVGLVRGGKQASALPAISRPCNLKWCKHRNIIQPAGGKYMASALIRAAFGAVLAAVLPFGAQSAAADVPLIDRFVVFGDSLSDPGNYFVDTREFEVRPYDPVPDAPYTIGRFHFTNGPTWIEQLARAFQLHRSGRPALLRPGVYTNYAYGRTRARPAGEFQLGEQVDQFLADFDGAAAPDTLYVLWIGAEDLRDALGNPGNALAIITAALGATAHNVQKLYMAGARSFLVLNLPDLGATPALRALGPGAQQAATGLTVLYNEELETVLGQLRMLPGILIVRFDVFGGLNALIADPDLAGLTNVTESCITPFVFRRAICQQPHNYLFWDFIHPTKAGHEYLAEQVQALLETKFLIVRPVHRTAPPDVIARFE